MPSTKNDEYSRSKFVKKRFKKIKKSGEVDQDITEATDTLTKNRHRKFKCQECTSEFTQTSSLRNHLKVIHCNTKNYQCPECDYKFHNSSNLKRHILKGHSVRSMEKIEYHKEKNTKKFLV